MKKRSLLIFVALALVPLILLAQISSPGSYSSVIMTFLRSTTAAAARTAIGAANSGSGGALTNAVIYGSTSGSVEVSATGQLGIGSAASASLLQIGSGTPTTAASGLQFGTDTAANFYRSTASIVKSDGWINGGLGVIGAIGQLSTVYPTEVGTDLRIQTRASGSANITFSSVGTTPTESARFTTSGDFGIGTTAPDKKLDVNSATGACLQLTYNDSNGSAANKATFDVSSGGNLTITPSGGFIGLGGATPTHALTFPSSSSGIALYNTADQVTNYERAVLNWSGNNTTIAVEKGGSGTSRTFNVSTGAGNFYFRGGGNASGIYQLAAVTTGTIGIFGYNFSGSGSSATSGSNTAMSLTPTYNQASGTAANTDLLINRTETAIGSGSQLLIDAQVGSSSKFSVSNSGAVTFAGYLAGGVQSLSGAGAVNVTQAITELTSTGVAESLTLANGVPGQEKTIIHGVDGGSMVLTPTTKTGFSTITFTTAGESVTLVYLTTRGWCVKSSYLATIAP